MVKRVIDRFEITERTATRAASSQERDPREVLRSVVEFTAAEVDVGVSVVDRAAFT